MTYKDTFLDGALYEGKSIRLIIEKMFDDYNEKLDKELFDCMTNGVVDVELYFRRKEKLSKEVLGE